MNLKGEKLKANGNLTTFQREITQARLLELFLTSISAGSFINLNISVFL